MIINMPLEAHSYRIHLHKNAILDLKEYLDTDKEVFVLTDENLFKLYELKLKEILCDYQVSFVVVKAGEHSKSLAVFEQVVDEFILKGIKRNSCLLAFGGGVIGDLGGFVASSLYRGIEYIQIPTSLLSMVDSSIGGKTGINTKMGKNLIGAFYNPKAVIIDPVFIKTLPDVEYQNGMAEIIKAALIKDKTLFEKLESNELGLLEMIERSILVKKDIVLKDPYEENLRMILNFGHSFGHIIESKSAYKIPHGFAVAEGMILAIKAGIKLKITPRIILKRLHNVLEKYNLGQQKIDVYEMIEPLFYDKKFKNGKLNFILIEDIGISRIYPITQEALNECYH
ncbi:MAG: 3-dehydroquinate synthase [Acholeplasma sp.]|nr:3-dehydroquinate synthase [Acholeplasma sp.]